MIEQFIFTYDVPISLKNTSSKVADKFKSTLLYR